MPYHLPSIHIHEFRFQFKIEVFIRSRAGVCLLSGGFSRFIGALEVNRPGFSGGGYPETG